MMSNIQQRCNKVVENGKDGYEHRVEWETIDKITYGLTRDGMIVIGLHNRALFLPVRCSTIQFYVLLSSAKKKNHLSLQWDTHLHRVSGFGHD